MDTKPEDKQQYIQEVLRRLHSDEVREITAGLGMIEDNPTGDQEILQKLEGLMADRRPCVVSIPLLYSELRLLVGSALAKERQAQSIKDIVLVNGVIKPIGGGTILLLAKTNHISTGGKSIEEILTILLERNLVPLTNTHYWVD